MVYEIHFVLAGYFRAAHFLWLLWGVILAPATLRQAHAQSAVSESIPRPKKTFLNVTYLIFDGETANQQQQKKPGIMFCIHYLKFPKIFPPFGQSDNIFFC